MTAKPALEKAGVRLVDLHLAKQLALKIGSGKKILSVQSGRGFLPAALKTVGMTVAAFDAVPPINTLTKVHTGEPRLAIKEWEKDSDVLLIPWAEGSEPALIAGMMHWSDKPIIVIGQRERPYHLPMNPTQETFWNLLDLEEMDIEYPSIRPFMTDKIYIGKRKLMYF